MTEQTKAVERASTGQNRAEFTANDIGCVIDRSAYSADTINADAIEFAVGYGFERPLFSGCVNGLTGDGLEMTWDDAESASHSGQCDDDCEALAIQPEIAKQLDELGVNAIREALKETGAWDSDDLFNDLENRNRFVWLAAGDITENGSEQLSEIADRAVDYLNEHETPAYCSFHFEDNSLFLSPSVEMAQEDCEFTSHVDQEYPADDYEGEWLHVNDHGNCTLYVRTNGADKEIWSVV